MTVAVRKFVITPPDKVGLVSSPVARLTHSIPEDNRVLKLARHMHSILLERDLLAADSFLIECKARAQAVILKRALRNNNPVEDYKKTVLDLLKKIYFDRENYSDTEIGNFRIRLNKFLDKVPELKDALSSKILLTYDQIENGAFDSIIKRRLSTPYHEFISLIKESPAGVDLDPVIENFYSLFKDPKYPEFDISEAGEALYQSSNELTNASVCAFIDDLLLKKDPIDLRDILTVTSFLDRANKDSLGYNFQIKGGCRELRRKIYGDLKWLNARVKVLAEKVEINPQTVRSLSDRNKLFEEISLSVVQILKRARQYSEC